MNRELLEFTAELSRTHKPFVTATRRDGPGLPGGPGSGRRCSRPRHSAGVQSIIRETTGRLHYGLIEE